MENNKKKIILYLRVSDIMQEEKESLAYQKKECLNYCKSKGYEVYKVIEEVGSAWIEGKRKGFEELKEEIEIGNFDTLILYSLSRLARNQYLAHSIFHGMKKNDIKLEIITEPFLNSDSPMNGVILALLASQAELESELKSKIVKRRMKEYARNGYWVFPPPRGYDLIKGILYPNAEAHLIREMFNDYLEGKSIGELSEKYLLSSAGIKNQLSNVAYIGKTKFGFEGRKNSKRVKGLPGEIFEGRHEGIIDELTFSQVQKMKKNRTRNYVRMNNSAKEKFILNGLLKYKNSFLRPRSVKRKDETYYEYYRYQKRNDKEFFMIKRELVDSQIVNELKKYSAQISLNKYKSSIHTNFNRKISLLETKRNKTVELYTEGFLEKSDFLKKIGKIDFDLKDLKNKKITSEKKPSKNINLQKKLNALMKNFDKKDYSEQSKILKIFIEEIIVEDKENIEIIFKL